MPESFPSAQTRKILSRIDEGGRIDKADALHLMEHAELAELSWAATRVRNRMNDPGRVSYAVDRNVNYTNICRIRCSFCAFARPEGSGQAYTLTKEELSRKAQETKALGGTGFLLQGGVNPSLSWDYYLDLVNYLHHELGLWVHGFSPVEIQAMARLNGLGLKRTLLDLWQAGLGSLPGGGAEILVDRMRAQLSPRKGDVASWLEVMDAAHEIGLSTTGTMMFGIGETWAERIEHLRVLREQQDRAVRRDWPGRHTAFTAWPFQSGHTRWEGKVLRPTDVEYLKLIAIARIYLDNFQHIQASWVTMGTRTGQVALHYGCDDMGSLMIEENVVRAAGTHHMVDRNELVRLIEGAGYVPWQRDCLYNRVG